MPLTNFNNVLWPLCLFPKSYSTNCILVTSRLHTITIVLVKRCIWTIFHDCWNLSQNSHLASSVIFCIPCRILPTGIPMWLSCGSVRKRLEFQVDWMRQYALLQRPAYVVCRVELKCTGKVHSNILSKHDKAKQERLYFSQIGQHTIMYGPEVVHCKSAG